MQPSFASVQKIVGYKCIAPGCDKMFDTRNSYNRHRAHRSYAGSSCADIGNGCQLISRGPASGDRPKLFSMRIALAQQHGANPGQRLCKCYAPLRTFTLMRKQLKRRLKSDYYAKFEHFYASLRIVTLTLGRGGHAPPSGVGCVMNLACVMLRKNCVKMGFLRKLRKLRKRVNHEFLRNLCIFA